MSRVATSAPLADRLVAQAESVPWHGRAAEAMRTRIKERAAHLRVAAGHHETAAESLARHLHEVDDPKEAIESIRAQGRLAHASRRPHRAAGSPPTTAGRAHATKTPPSPPSSLLRPATRTG